MDSILMVKLSKADKEQIRNKWVNSIIVKPYGKLIPFGFLDPKLRQLWKLIENMDLIDLGHDFHLARFDLHEDFKNTIARGPWFVAG